MRRALTFVLAGLTAAAIGCSSDEKVTTEPAGNSSAASVPSERTPSSGSRADSAAVGDTLDLTGLKNGEALAVTVVKVVDPARADNEFSTPDAGKRFVAVQFRLKNTGRVIYSDSPANGARLVDTQGQQFGTAYEDTTAGPGFPGSVIIAPGDTGLGFITFEVPNSSRIFKVQFAMNSGFSGNTGQWEVSGD
ncbi:DUF4352 domain-containing protein [Streptomyces sp. H34-S4]|uniref:DUF4352 domain-containing protein n=1 Tax=Streptomyces sp. H34-S4 TaxID=2996463 RepID=UPI0022706DC5|nr:DUF4352 domain-containing protein [Streptomyces sp. H34-S4]MCY0933870.1 DUF4352 domain-containing protein [Streptomyces sp. H34-S4]